MLFLNHHGRKAVEAAPRDADAERDALPLEAACGFAAAESRPADPPMGPFRYFFPQAPGQRDRDDSTEALDALGDAMIADPGADAEGGEIPPVMTYLGQFIDHDVTANTDREVGLSRIDARRVAPAARNDVIRGLGNLREGALNLDSLYGGATVQGGFAAKLRHALRYPKDRAKMWVGTAIDTGDGVIRIPADPARDLLRLGRLLEPDGPLTQADLDGLPRPLRDMFVDEDGSPRVQRAIIADQRNDENLAVAQLHLAFLRLHNSVADVAHKHGGPTDDVEARFEWARRATTDIYQWLVLNAYLPAICDPDALRDVIEAEAPLYRRMIEDLPAPRGAFMPMPLEFSVAAFRFGHSMVRGAYDWNRLFGAAEGGSRPILPEAPFELLFAFTGGGRPPMPLTGGRGSAPRLPAHWPVEWARLAGPFDPAFPDRAARPIDTRLAPPLGALANEDEGEKTVGVMRQLARRNLRRGLRLNLPTAQGCLDALADATGTRLPALTREQLLDGPTGDAVAAGGFEAATPLWFYVLKEAETLGREGRLGPLGSRLVAETLVGLLVHDPLSVWGRTGSGPGGVWTPADGPRPNGVAIDGMPAFFRAAGLI